MQYVGMQTQISRNNRMTVLLLLMFPAIILGVVWAFIALVNYFGNGYYNQYGEIVHQMDAETVNYSDLKRYCSASTNRLSVASRSII